MITAPITQPRPVHPRETPHPQQTAPQHLSHTITTPIAFTTRTTPAAPCTTTPYHTHSNDHHHIHDKQHKTARQHAPQHASPASAATYTTTHMATDSTHNDKLEFTPSLCWGGTALGGSSGAVGLGTCPRVGLIPLSAVPLHSHTATLHSRNSCTTC